MVNYENIINAYLSEPGFYLILSIFYFITLLRKQEIKGTLINMGE